jgi:hypothetical protein
MRRGDRLHVLVLVRRAALDGVSSEVLAELTRDYAARLAGLARMAADRYAHTADPSAVRWIVAEHRSLQGAFDAVVGRTGQCAEADEETAWYLLQAILVAHSRYSVQDSGQPPSQRLTHFADADDRMARAPISALVQHAVRLYSLGDLGRLERAVAGA